VEDIPPKRDVERGKIVFTGNISTEKNSMSSASTSKNPMAAPVSCEPEPAMIATFNLSEI
jgi:hypothetical protein